MPVYIFLQWQFQFSYVKLVQFLFFSSMAFLSEKAFLSTCMHLYTKVVRKSLAGGVYTAGDNLLARTPSTHQLADNKLVSSVFSR